MNVKEAIRKLAVENGEMYSKICVVDSIDENARTVDVSPIDGSAPVLAVNLQANQEGENGFVAFPKQGSHVVVSFLSGATAVVVLMEEVEKIIAVIGKDKPIKIMAEDSAVSLELGDTTIDLKDDKSITFNKGDNGGLVIIEKLTNKINEFITTFNNHTHGGVITAVSGGSGAPAVGTPGNSGTPTSSAKSLNKKDYENSKIKH